MHIFKKSKTKKQNKSNKHRCQTAFSGEINFESFLDGSWQGFGRPKSSIFVMFVAFFRRTNLNVIWKGKKFEKMELQMATASSKRLSAERADPPREGKGRDYVIC